MFRDIDVIIEWGATFDQDSESLDEIDSMYVSGSPSLAHGLTQLFQTEKVYTLVARSCPDGAHSP